MLRGHGGRWEGLSAMAWGGGIDRRQGWRTGEARSFYEGLLGARRCARRFAYVLPFAPPNFPLVIVIIIINNRSPVAHTEPAWLELKAVISVNPHDCLGNPFQIRMGAQWLRDFPSIRSGVKSFLSLPEAPHYLRLYYQDWETSPSPVRVK